MWNPAAPVPHYYYYPGDHQPDQSTSPVFLQPPAPEMLVPLPVNQPPTTPYFYHYFYPNSIFLPLKPTYYYQPAPLLPPTLHEENVAAPPPAVASSSSGRARVRPMHPNADETTVMIKNVPCRYNRRMMRDYLDGHCLLKNDAAGGRSCMAYDFLYLPFDFERKLNKSYAFVNFTSAGAAWDFYGAANNKRWAFCESQKVAKIVCATVQGLDQLRAKFEGIVFPCDTDDYLPVLFDPPRDGSNDGVVQQFTVGRRGF